MKPDNTQDNKVGSHTPRWGIEESTVVKSSKVRWDTRFVIDENGKRIAMCYGETMQEAKANAELIASAPLLLAENEQLKKERKARTEQMAYTFQVGNDAKADNLKLKAENEKLKADKAVLLQALEGVLNNVTGNGEVHLSPLGKVLNEIRSAIKQATNQ